MANLLNLLRTDFAVPMSHALRIEEEDGPFGERVDTLETISKNLLACCIVILVTLIFLAILLCVLDYDNYFTDRATKIPRLLFIPAVASRC